MRTEAPKRSSKDSNNPQPLETKRISSTMYLRIMIVCVLLGSSCGPGGKNGAPVLRNDHKTAILNPLNSEQSFVYDPTFTEGPSQIYLQAIQPADPQAERVGDSHP